MLVNEPHAHHIAAVSLALDRVEYVAGDIVRGTVCITATQRFECTTILVVATGLETANWNYDMKPGLSRAQQNVCYKQEIMVSPAERVFEPGEHTCKFECTLPLVLPGSFVLPASYTADAYVKYTSASIAYKFEASMEFLSLLDRDAHRSRHLHGTHGFIVHETHPELVALPRMDETLRAPVASCCTLLPGRCDLRAWIQHDVVYQGDRIDVVCEIKNESSQTIAAITCRLVQRISLRLYDRVHVEEREVGAWRFGPVRPYEHTTRTHDVTIESTRGSTENQALVPPSTSNGTVVQCHYVVHVDAYVPSGSELTVQLPITVQSLLHRDVARESSPRTGPGR